MSKGNGKKAKTLTEKQIAITLAMLARGSGKDHERDVARFLLSVSAGLRAKEVAAVTWAMVMDSEGNVGPTLSLTNMAAKGDSGRHIPISKPLRAALIALQAKAAPSPTTPIIGGTANATTVWFKRLYDAMDFTGCSSHSGRRTAITRWARKITEAGGSMRDVQKLAGHTNLGTTQEYVELHSDAMVRVVDM